MKTIAREQVAATTGFLLQANPSRRHRVLYLEAEVSGVVAGMQMRAEFVVGSDRWAATVTPPLLATTERVHFAVGGTPSGPDASADTLLVAASLPDVWWEQTIRVLVNPEGAATVATQAIVYEVDSGSKP